MKKYAVLHLLVSLLLLTACGGGGSNTTTNTNTSQTNTVTTGAAQGVYSGTATGGQTFEGIVLPTDKFYAIYGTTQSNTFLIYGMLTGQGASSNGNFTGSFSDFYYTGSTYTGSLSASYVAGTSFNGTYTENGTSTTFSASALPTSSFNYNSPASLSAITGTWAGNFLDGSSATVTISSSGSLTGSNAGCSFTGSIAPDASNKNFYTLSVAFGTGSCLLPNQTATGHAISYLSPDNVHHTLLMAGTASNRGTLFLATR